jgi:hypothetical protein
MNASGSIATKIGKCLMCQDRIANRVGLVVLLARKQLQMSVAVMAAIRSHGFFV